MTSLRLMAGLTAAALVAGCSGAHLDNVPTRVHVREKAEAYQRCVNTAAEPLITDTQLSAQRVAVIAIGHCAEDWRAFIDIAEQDYLLQTHSASDAHRQAMIDAFHLNMVLQNHIDKEIKNRRETPAAAG